MGEAFKGVEGIDVTILYPRDEVSGRQKKQLDTIGGNVRAVSVDGKFDDCQNLVKQAFSDPAFADFNLTSANSINFGRILPQIIYYVYAWAQLARETESGRLLRPLGQFRRRPRLRVRPADGAPRGEAHHADERKRRVPPFPGDRRL